MRMTREHWDQLVAHAREEQPNECCGWVRAKAGDVHDVFPAVGSRTWQYGFELGFKDLMAITEAEDDGYEIAVYHSHPRSSAEPSQTDINLAPGAGWTYLIVSLDGAPVVRAWRIADGRVEEEEIVVAAA